ncbi:spexin isoform X1 [Molossus molossus]|uniref:spexin isoform X1 n=1 Tax=Molossus molossus TaxID=27622 RepID=UPI001746D9D6|nr:spexin isoform X1 [Molossus molossus]
MLYLKGAQGRRFISDQSQRKELSDRPPPERRSPDAQLLTLPEAAALLLASLQKPQEGPRLLGRQGRKRVSNTKTESGLCCEKMGWRRKP